MPFTARAEQAFSPVRPTVDPAAALIILDTNVLLAPYKTSAAALDEIKRIYRKLRAEARLIVPAQVAREFARNRPNLVADLYKLVRDARTLSINGRYDPPPAVRGMREHQKAEAELAKMQAALRSYRTALTELADKIAEWRHTDPVVEVYGSLFDAATVRELSLDVPTIEDIRKARYAAKIPPGYKDKGKDDGGGGDLIIWLTILEIAEEAKRDVIFITEETKEDWFHRAGDEAIFPRYELALEFAGVTSGKAFDLMTLSKLLDALGAKESVVEEVKEQERAVPLWTASRLEQQVLARLVDIVGIDAIALPQGFPDIVVSFNDVRIGIEILSGSYRSEPIRRAIDAVRKGTLSEIAIVFVAADASNARSLENRFAEESFLGTGVAAIVVYPVESGLATLVNQATHPVLRRAFTVG